MSWLGSIAVGFLTGLVGLFAGGLVAGLAVNWYRISSFEGGSGYFVVGLALLAGIAGAILGIATAKIVGAGPHPGFLRSVGFSSGILLAVIGAIGGIARLLADIPPEIDGEQLFLDFEVRWPADAEDPRATPGLGYSQLGASNGGVLRKSEAGVLFLADASLIEGRWIVPGAAPVFTSRGKRVLRFGIGERELGAFQVPLPAHPGEAERQWSAWLPHARPGDPPLPDGFRYRFRVHRQSEPLRTDTLGPITVVTVAGYFFGTVDADGLAANSTFHLTAGDRPIAVAGDIGAIAVLPDDPTALLVQADGGQIYLITTDASTPRVQAIGAGGNLGDAKAITTDTAVFRSFGRRALPRGWIDRLTFARPGLYQLGELILDTRTRTPYPLKDPEGIYPLDTPGLIGVSPDERSVVWLAHEGSEEHPVLGVTDFHVNESYWLPIDRTRMRYNQESAIDPAWVAHHFSWHRTKGVDRLTERAGFVPLPYHGDLFVGKPGEYASYDLRPAGVSLRDTVVEILVRDLGAERVDEPDSYQRKVRIDSKVITVSAISGEFVSVGTEYQQADPALMRRIAERIDGLLATGKYDALFGPPK